MILVILNYRIIDEIASLQILASVQQLQSNSLLSILFMNFSFNLLLYNDQEPVPKQARVAEKLPFNREKPSAGPG